MKRSLVTLLFGLLVLAVLGVVQVSLATSDNSVSPLGAAESAPASVVAQRFTFNRDRAMTFASKSLNFTPSRNFNAAVGGNLRTGKSYGNDTAKRYCATYLAYTMNAGGIPIETSFTGNHQILQYLTEKSGGSGGSGSNLSIEELASNIRKNSYVAEVTINSMPMTVRPGDIIFFNVSKVSCGWFCNKWGAIHSAIITNENQSPVRLAYWNVEKYDVPFNEVRKSFTRDYIVVRFR